MNSGLVFHWVENDTYWICFLHHLEEIAYFRGEAYLTGSHLADINGTNYRVYFKGPDQMSIDWHIKANDYFNKPNYTKTLWITKNEETDDYFHRFQKIIVDGDPWEIVSVNRNYGNESIIRAWVKEDYNNMIADIGRAEKTLKEKENPPVNTFECYPFSEWNKITVDAISEEQAYITNKSKDMKCKLVATQIINGKTEIIYDVLSGKSGTFDIVYGDNTYHIKVLSL